MRKFGLVMMLAAAAIAGTGCNLTGADGSWAGYNGGSNNAAGAATLSEITVAVTADGGATWWCDESLTRYNQCSTQVILQLYHQFQAPATFGRYFDTGEGSAHPMGQVYSSATDTNGDGWVAAPSIAQINAGAGGYTSGIAFYPLCSQDTIPNIPFDDELSIRQLTPLNGYFSTGLTDNLSAFALPLYSNDSNNHDIDIQSGVSRLPLATRIEILKTIDVNEDVVREVMPGGVVREDIKARLTSITVDGETYVPSSELAVVIRDFAAVKLDLTDAAYRPFAGWLADRLQAALDAGREPSGSVTINDSLTISSQEVRSLLPDMQYSWAGQLGVDRLRSYAGTLDRSSLRRNRLDRRFAEEIRNDVDFGISKGQ